MAYTAPATQGYEPLRKTSGEEIFYMPGNPGVTYTKGDKVFVDLPTAGVSGLISPVVDGTANAIGTVMRTTVCPAATQGFAAAHEFSAIDSDADDLCLIPVKLTVASGLLIDNVTFKNHIDDTVITYTAGTRAIAGTTGHTADDYPNGGLLFVYEGTGKGQVNIVEDYNHAGGAAALLLIMHRAFKTPLDNTSKYIVLTGEGATYKGISLLGRIDAADVNELDASDGADDGDFVVFMDWLKAPTFLGGLRLPVIRANALF